MSKGSVCIIFTYTLLVVFSPSLCCMRRQSQKAPDKIRPVIFVHGILPKADEYEFPQTYITKHLPGAVFYNIDLFYEKLESAFNLKYQLTYFIPAMEEGGVICRAVVEMVSTHNVHTMITLSSPLAGQFGMTSFVREVLPFLPSATREYVWKFFYTEVGQEESVAAYWNDPHHQKEFADPELDILLARLNNQTGHNSSKEYKKNFLKLQNLVMITGPNDTVITPYQSAHFGFYDSDEKVKPMEEQMWYEGDEFGLKTLNEAGKVIRLMVDGVIHQEWHKTAKVFDCCVLPYL